MQATKACIASSSEMPYNVTSGTLNHTILYLPSSVSAASRLALYKCDCG